MCFSENIGEINMRGLRGGLIVSSVAGPRCRFHNKAWWGTHAVAVVTQNPGHIFPTGLRTPPSLSAITFPVCCLQIKCIQPRGLTALAPYTPSVRTQTRQMWLTWKTWRVSACVFQWNVQGDGWHRKVSSGEFSGSSFNTGMKLIAGHEQTFLPYF